MMFKKLFGFLFKSKKSDDSSPLVEVLSFSEKVIVNILTYELTMIYVNSSDDNEVLSLNTAHRLNSVYKNVVRRVIKQLESHRNATNKDIIETLRLSLTNHELRSKLKRAVIQNII